MASVIANRVCAFCFSFAFALANIACTASYLPSGFSSDDVPYTDTNNRLAVKEIQRQLFEDPGDTFKRHQLVDIYLEELMLDLAIEELHRIIRLDRKDARAYQLLSILLYKQQSGDLDSAISTLRSGIDVLPRNVEMRSLLAILYVESGELGQGAEEAGIVLRLTKDPQVAASAHLILASIFSKKGQTDLAEEHYQKSIALNPSIAHENDPFISLPVYTGALSPLFFFPTHPELMDRARSIDRHLR